MLKTNYLVIQDSINYCRPAFEQVSTLSHPSREVFASKNPFFKEYESAIEIGKHILKRFSYNITQTSLQEVETPPFWIDMPILFELYVYAKLLEANPEHREKIHYQFATYGNELDFLINVEDNQMIIDTKYKPIYESSQVHEDIRQVSGYGRLRKVRDTFNIPPESDKIIDCLIIYPRFDSNSKNYKLNDFQKEEIKAYHKIWKMGVEIPEVSR